MSSEAPAREHADRIEVQAFRALVTAVESGDVRRTIQAQRELRRLGWTCFASATRHAPPDPGQSQLRGRSAD